MDIDAAHRNALIVVAKRPAAGHTKTRLTPPLTPEQAAGLYECFLLDTLDLMRCVSGIQPVLAYLPPGEEDYFHQLAPGFEMMLQDGDDLGARLDNVSRHYLGSGYLKVVVMDSDSPTLPLEYLQGAFEALEGDVDLVLGPCDDGGYYLIGLRKPAPRLLREVRMSTSRVTADTLKLASEEGLRVQLLPVWYDVDDGPGLARLQTELRHLPQNTAPHTRHFLRSFRNADAARLRSVAQSHSRNDPVDGPAR